MAEAEATPAPDVGPAPVHRTVRLSWTAAITIVGTILLLIVGRGVFVAAHRPLSWAAAAVIAAALLDPLVDHLARHIGRPVAVLLVFLGIGALGVGTTYLVFDEVEAAIDSLQEAGPEAARSVEDREDRLGEIARDARLEERITDGVTALQERVTGGEDVLRTTAGTAPTYFVSAILTVFLMTYGPRIASAAVAQDTDAARRRRITDLVDHAVNRARRAIVLTIALSVSYGVLAAAIATALDLPAPSAVGFTAGLFALLPHVGIVVGSLPLLLLTVGGEPGRVSIPIVAVVIALQVVDSVVVRRWVARRSLTIGLLVPWTVAMLAYAVYGVGAAAYGLAAAVFVLAVLDRLAETANRAPSPA